MRNPFRKRNLMSRRDNPYMRAYQDDRETVRNTLEVARHSSALDRSDVKNSILMNLSKRDYNAIKDDFRMGSINGGVAGGMIGALIPFGGNFVIKSYEEALTGLAAGLTCAAIGAVVGRNLFHGVYRTARDYKFARDALLRLGDGQ